MYFLRVYRVVLTHIKLTSESFFFFVTAVCFFLKKLLWQGVAVGRGDFPGGPVVMTLPFNAGVMVGSLVGELRSHIFMGQNPQRT